MTTIAHAHQTRATGRVAVTPLGGPTVVLDVAGIRLLVDPTFDAPGRYAIGERWLVKTEPPAWRPEHVGPVTAVLLSHDQHPDNLDNAGRAVVASAPRVFTTVEGACRLGGTAIGLRPWQRTHLALPGGGVLRVTATPAQHGPPGTTHLTGPVVGFVLHGDGVPTIYVSGDNASLDVVRAVARRYAPIDVAVLFAGGAKSALLGDAYLTLSSAMAADAVRLLGRPHTMVVHTDGWNHFTEPGSTLPAAFAAAGVAETLVSAMPGETVLLVVRTRSSCTASGSAPSRAHTTPGRRLR